MKGESQQFGQINSQSISMQLQSQADTVLYRNIVIYSYIKSTDKQNLLINILVFNINFICVGN